MRLAIDIGATTTAFASFDEAGAPIHLQDVPTQRSSWSDFKTSMMVGITQAEQVIGSIDDIGISVAGTIDPQTNIVTCANISAISNRPLVDDLAALFGRPVIVRNDAECLALAEALGGIGQNYNTVFAVILGSGIGGAIVINSKLVTGATGQIGEWGHGNQIDHLVKKHGLADRQCGCGRRNCLDSFGAGLGMANIHADLFDENLTAKDILSKWRAGDVEAKQTVTTFIDLVSAQLALAINVVDPEIVPVAGGLSQDARLIDELDRATRARSLGQLQRPLIIPAANNQHGCLLGAAMLTAETTGVLESA